MGNGVPNQGPWQHRQPGKIVGYLFRYHDQLVTGNSTVESAEIPPGDYAQIRSAAVAGPSAFAAALAGSAWGPFFAAYPGINLVEARLGVLDLG